MERDPQILDRARTLRREMTPAEKMLWARLRGGQLLGTKFVKQATIDRYVVDFAARSHHLVVEVDGDTHTDVARDAARTARLGRYGYHVIRFTNADVLTNVDGVLTAIMAALHQAPPPTPSPTGRGL